MKRVLCLTGLLLASLVISGCDKGRMWETPAVRPHEEEITVTPAETVPFSGGEMIWRSTPAEELASPVDLASEAEITEGKRRYFQFCAQCHGKYHDGNGTVGQSFKPLPTDLRSDLVQEMGEGVLFKTISYGIEEKRQPALATTIAPMDRWRIIAYVKSLGPR